MSNLKKLIIILFVGICALFSQFVFHSPKIAYYIIAIVGGIMAIIMFISMIKTIKSGTYGVDILAITAIISTLVVGEYWASLVVLIMLAGGDSLEDYASKQASKELTSLLNNSPEIAHKIENNFIEDVSVNNIKIGDKILVKSGEIVPVDGYLLTENLSLDESSLTGESKPVEKKTGDTLMSGSLNGEGSFTYEATKTAKDSQYQSLVRLVQESKEKPAKFVRLADQYAVPFTIIAYVIGGISWFISKEPIRFAEVMVVASPCPLILAAPIALVAGMSKSSRNGIVVKNGTVLERMAQAKTVAFDKTGTLTEGILTVQNIQTYQDLIEPEKLLQLAASAEQNSSHILARSLVEYAKKQNIDLLSCDDFEETTGQGVSGKINKQIIRVGKARFAYLNEEQGVNQTTIYIAIANKYVGKIVFADTVRPETKDTVAKLKLLGIKKIIMLTGDNQLIADSIAKEVGINEVYADCLPEDKIKILNNIPPNMRPEIMVGDGVNDAPALSTADIGIAMGARGSSAASESADIVILKDDLSRVATGLKISKRTMKIAKQSVLIGILICTILMLIASTGVLPALLGAALQELVDVTSILSALRARK
ncbi:heavy metal translocating P-type ATPase [Enterococcus alishanensis]